MVIDLLDDDGLLALGPAEAPAEGAPCHVCRTRPPRITCRSCARPACAADSWAMFGLCSACASERQVRRWHSRGEVEGGNWLE